MRESPSEPAKYSETLKRVPVVYRPNFADLARKYALLGCNDARIAELLGVPLSQLMDWQMAYPELEAFIRDGRELADAEVATAIYQRACGYSHPAVKFWLAKSKDAEGNETIEVIEKAYVERYPPDVGAAQFWLTNRASQSWQNSSKQTVDGSLELKVTGISALLALAKTEATQLKRVA